MVVMKPLLDAEGLVHHFDDGGDAVRGAGGVGDDVVCGRVVHVFVDAEDDGQVFALGGCADDDLLGAAAVDVGTRLVCVGEAAGGLDDEVDAELAPGDGGGVALRDDLDALTVDLDGAVGGG